MKLPRWRPPQHPAVCLRRIALNRLPSPIWRAEDCGCAVNILSVTFCPPAARNWSQSTEPGSHVLAVYECKARGCTRLPPVFTKLMRQASVGDYCDLEPRGSCQKESRLWDHLLAEYLRYLWPRPSHSCSHAHHPTQRSPMGWPHRSDPQRLSSVRYGPVYLRNLPAPATSAANNGHSLTITRRLRRACFGLTKLASRRAPNP